MNPARPLPVKRRPRCFVCGKPLATHYVYETRDIPQEVFERIKALPFGKQRKYVDADGAKLQWLEYGGEQRGQYQATFRAHDGKYGLDGDGHFHAQSCAVRYGEAAAKLRDRIIFTRR